MEYADICVRFAWQHGEELALVGHFLFLVTFLSRLTMFISEAIAKKHVNLPERYPSPIHICPLA